MYKRIKLIEMKKIILLLIIACVGGLIHAQNLQEVVYLKNGSIIRGVIIEQIPGESLKIQTPDGSIFAYNMGEVEKMTKESNQLLGISAKSSTLQMSYKGFLDLGYVFDLCNYNASRLEITTSHGCQFSPYVFVGAGVGIDYYADADFIGVPIFAHLKANFFSRKITPYFDAKIGHSIGDVHGIYFTPSIGCRIGINEKSGINIGIGYSMQKATINYEFFGDIERNISGLSLKIGFDF